MRTALVCVAILTLGMGCPKKEPDTAKPTSKAASPVPAAITTSSNAVEAALAASEKKVTDLELRGAKVAASVVVAETANTNQPAGPLTDFVSKELKLALDRLPKPDPTELLVAEQRKVAVLTGQVEETRKLYNAAQSETERMKSETTRLKAEAEAARQRSTEASAALAAAEKSHAAALERNKAENQAKIDAAVKRADEAEEKAKNERHKTIFRTLLGLGIACIAGAIAMAVMTSGAMIAKSLMLAGAGALCIGLAQIISHPWFDRVFGTCVGLAAVGGAVYLWHERKDAIRKVGYEKTVKVLEGLDLTAVPTKDDEGKDSNLAMELSRKLGDSEKSEVKKMRVSNEIRDAKQRAKT